MKSAATVLVSVGLLAGCASPFANWTPEQRAAFAAQMQAQNMQSQQIQAANNRAFMDSLNRANAQMQQPVNPYPYGRPVQCTSQQWGNQVYTNCR